MKQNTSVFLRKKKYSQKEFISIIDGIKNEYIARESELKNQIAKLIEDNEYLKDRLRCFEDKEQLILDTVEAVVVRSKNIDEELELRYKSELERLKNFSFKINKFLSNKSEENNCDMKARKTVKLFCELNYGDVKNTEKINRISEILDNNIEGFDPKEKIENYIVATSDNGFNIEEVLNPGQLHLEELCKELGLTEKE